MVGQKLFKESVIMVKLLKESIAFAFSQLKGDKFRTFLSLFGVSIGIFSIVAIFSAIDALKENVKSGFDSLSGDAVQISKFPSGIDSDELEGGEYKWWEYIKRPNNTYEDFRFLKTHSKTAEAIAILTFINHTLKYERNSVSGALVIPASYDFNKVAKLNMESGRYFSTEEDKGGSPVAIIGYEIANELFNGGEAVGKKIKIGSHSAEVIGVMEKQGESMVNMFNNDEAVIIPVNFGRYMVNIRNNMSNSIFAIPKKSVSQEEFVDEIKSLMRAQRRLKPGEKNNFSIIQMTMMLDMIQSIFDTLNKVGWLIAGFSLLIGGFGIANIMFVSVKERTNIIGIQKALGAKKYVIMSQFLVEAAFLAVAGGIIGILMVAGIVALIPSTGGFTLHLSLSNILNGVGIASIIGIISGLTPAWMGANLNPVDAINSK